MRRSSPGAPSSRSITSISSTSTATRSPSADSWCFRTDRDEARERGTKYTEAARPRAAVHRRQLAEYLQLYAEEEVRGATPRYWEDVAGGDALPRDGQGADDGHRLHRLRARLGRTLHPRQQARLEVRSQTHPGLGIANRFGIPDCPERVHWEPEFARMVGAPGAYDYGPERCSWLTHQLTNWMGDDGFLRRASARSAATIRRAIRCSSAAG